MLAFLLHVSTIKCQNLDYKTRSLAAFSEVQSIQYQNFNFEPLLLYFSSGLHYNRDILTSEKNYAIGINQCLTFANSLQFRKVYFFEYFSYVYSRMGFIDKNDDNSIVCFRVGIGPNIYSDYEQMENWSVIVVPNYFFETILDLGRPIFFRYHRTFFS
ncbi:MAG: hypothetical protein KatS3mg035_0796 [Bacteroidia bacterium]|nr:MAG: hypothetical protein KatS3mg035_0796 [Bacteroidia bacterium]